MIATMVSEPAAVIGLVGGILLVLFAALTVVGVVLIARRSRRVAAAPPPGRTDAGVALVRADDAVRTGADDLAFAVAQFGEDRTRSFADALAAGRADLDAAFRLQQRLDDTRPDSERQRREWTREIRTRAERAASSIAREAAAFEQLRRSEANAPETLRLLRRNLDAIAARRAAGEATMSGLRAAYAAEALAPVAGNLADADAALAAARAAADSAQAALATSTAPAVSDAVAEVQARSAQAGQLLDAIDRRRDELAHAAESIAAIRDEEQLALADARTLRDTAPDPDSGALVNAAIAHVEAELVAVAASGPRDPVADLDRLVEASDRLDIAVAGARNQQRRLDGAREALAGALVSAQAQLAAVSDFIGSRGGGADARTRLAEGERELLLARNEADPVAALDAARRAQTHARDADALARWRG